MIIGGGMAFTFLKALNGMKVCVCVRACVRVCMRVCVRVHVCAPSACIYTEKYVN